MGLRRKIEIRDRMMEADERAYLRLSGIAALMANKLFVLILCIDVKLQSD